MRNAEFNNPRLTEVYDAECLWGRDDEFFLAFVNETPGSKVLDLGCGTGRVTLAIAAAGHHVTGVDPAGASLDRARTKPGSELVQWIEGVAADLPDSAFDVAVMTAHVSQFLDDDEFLDTMKHLSRVLVPGGRLIFDSRDPSYRVWEAWNPKDSAHQVTLGDGDTVGIWTEVTAVEDERVDFTHHYVWPDGDELVSDASLYFRSAKTIHRLLVEAGLVVGKVRGGWNGEAVGEGDGEFIVAATLPGA